MTRGMLFSISSTSGPLCSLCHLRIYDAFTTIVSCVRMEIKYFSSASICTWSVSTLGLNNSVILLWGCLQLAFVVAMPPDFSGSSFWLLAVCRNGDVSAIDHMIKTLRPFSLCCKGSKARAREGLGLYPVILQSVCVKKVDRNAEVTWSKRFPNLSLHLHLSVLVLLQYIIF